MSMEDWSLGRLAAFKGETREWTLAQLGPEAALDWDTAQADDLLPEPQTFSDTVKMHRKTEDAQSPRTKHGTFLLNMGILLDVYGDMPRTMENLLDWRSLLRESLAIHNAAVFPLVPVDLTLVSGKLTMTYKETFTAPDGQPRTYTVTITEQDEPNGTCDARSS